MLAALFLFSTPPPPNATNQLPSAPLQYCITGIFVNVCLFVFLFFVVASTLPCSLKVSLQLQYIASYPSEKIVLFLVVTDAVIHIFVVVVCFCSSCCFCKCCRYTDCALPPECPQVPAGLPGKVGTSAQVLVYSATILVHTIAHYPSPHYFDHSMDIIVRHAQHYWHQVSWDSGPAPKF